VYFNIFYGKFVENAKEHIVPVMVKAGIINPRYIQHAIELTSQSLINRIKDIPGVEGHPDVWNNIVVAGRLAYAESYKHVYYASIGKLICKRSVLLINMMIAFGGISIIAACFLGDIEKYMDDHVAVVLH
jgi:hypothetical protein